MEEKYIVWFCKEVSDSWSEFIDMVELYNKFMDQFPKADEQEVLDCLDIAVQIVSDTRLYGAGSFL